MTYNYYTKWSIQWEVQKKQFGASDGFRLLINNLWQLQTWSSYVRETANDPILWKYSNYPILDSSDCYLEIEGDHLPLSLRGEFDQSIILRNDLIDFIQTQFSISPHTKLPINLLFNGELISNKFTLMHFHLNHLSLVNWQTIVMHNVFPFPNARKFRTYLTADETINYRINPDPPKNINTYLFQETSTKHNYSSPPFLFAEFFASKEYSFDFICFDYSVPDFYISKKLKKALILNGFLYKYDPLDTENVTTNDCGILIQKQII